MDFSMTLVTVRPVSLFCVCWVAESVLTMHARKVSHKCAEWTVRRLRAVSRCALTAHDAELKYSGGKYEFAMKKARAPWRT